MDPQRAESPLNTLGGAIRTLKALANDSKAYRDDAWRVAEAAQAAEQTIHGLVSAGCG